MVEFLIHAPTNQPIAQPNQPIYLVAMIRVAAVSLLSSSLFAATTATAATAAAASCTTFANTDFDGHDLHATHADDAGGCCDACDTTAGCAFWTFMPPHTCYMKTSSAGKRAMPHYTSGCKGSNCTLPPTPAVSE